MEGRISIVLVRLQYATGGEAKDVLVPTLHGRRWAIRTVALDTGARPETVGLLSPSRQSQRDGWLALSLPPGAHWLSIVPSDARPGTYTYAGNYGYYARNGDFTPVPAFLLDVRGSEPVLYAGTVELTADRPTTPPRVRVLDESSRARELVARELPRLAGAVMATRLLEPYGSALAPEAIHDLVPMGLGTVGAGSLGGPPWITRALGLWMAPAGEMIGAGAIAINWLGVAAVALGVAYLPVGVLGGAVQGVVQQHVRQECLDELGTRLRETPPGEWLWRPIGDAFSAHVHEVPLDDADGARTMQSKVRSVLLAGLTRVELVEDTAGEFAVEVGLRARLWDAAARRWAYDRSFLYGPGNGYRAGTSRRPYETPLAVASPARAIDAYCSPDGWELVRGDLHDATRLLVQELTADLGLGSGRPETGAAPPVPAPGAVAAAGRGFPGAGSLWKPH